MVACQRTSPCVDAHGDGMRQRSPTAALTHACWSTHRGSVDARLPVNARSAALTHGARHALTHDEPCVDARMLVNAHYGALTYRPLLTRVPLRQPTHTVHAAAHVRDGDVLEKLLLDAALCTVLRKC